MQSVGGGTSTTLLVQRAFVERHGWITPEEFRLFWTLSLLSPGVNLIAIALLIGRRLGGLPGATVSVLGLLVPSSAVVCLLTAGLTAFQSSSMLQAALRGIVPAAGSLLILVALTFAWPVVQTGIRAGTAGKLRAGAGVTTALGCAAVLAAGRFPVVPVLFVASILGALTSHPSDSGSGQQKTVDSTGHGRDSGARSASGHPPDVSAPAAPHGQEGTTQ